MHDDQKKLLLPFEQVGEMERAVALLRAQVQYARPWSGARGTRIAIVVGGLGLNQTGTQRAIRDLPPEVTLAFAAAGNSLQRWMQEARRDGHEILLQVPMEPFDYATNDPGPHALRVSSDAGKNLAELHRSMGQITNYTGVMNYLGGRFLSNADALEPVMRDLGKRGLLFLDDGTSAQSLSGTLAGAFDVPHGFADLVLDGELSRNAVLRRLDELERIARRNGTAIGVASAFDESVAAIAEWIEEAGGRASRWSAWPHSSKIRNKTDLSAVDHRVIRLAATCKGRTIWGRIRGAS
ncbi:polysaccharide deacetylase [Sinorhizobium meliloti CCBAU 01290]|nr:polysaccharide deacetylase [Sinorhizobium meliloti CCBAU 01290]